MKNDIELAENKNSQTKQLDATLLKDEHWPNTSRNNETNTDTPRLLMMLRQQQVYLKQNEMTDVQQLPAETYND